MEFVRIGIIGLGNMGSSHCIQIHIEHKVPGLKLAAVCDISEERREWAGREFPGVPVFEHATDMYQSGLIDAVLVAVPHYDHPSLSIEAFSHGLHVLVEKPAGVYTKQVLMMNAAAAKSDKVFCIMYNQRTNPVYQKLRELVQDGELGELKRVVWIVTDWYRPQAYHDSGSWRSTWKGEGGGTLINQNPHNLDLLQWILGMPKRLRSFVSFGKYYNIEVEDDVTAYLEYANGASGVYITSTGESPGTNRLELSGDRGKIVVENNKITFHRNRIPEREHNRSNTEPFKRPEAWVCDIPVVGTNEDHVGIMKSFTQAILKGTPLLSPGEEGIHGLTISNAIHYSTWTNDWVDLEQFNHDHFHELLLERIQHSKVEKKLSQKVVDVTGTY
ncbi:Gfo/Idh/MocA family protein [Paenibacillus roseipurpureus]|uniref:Gfo/Idh/MocA family oxidoreductase n=1 Tax=Paenibacillus roseopurpureus TaxID=2918901 RepID=A0AA96LSZ3_9BACL|nr:Gfo/Idh/MocA family oxidoreductase [Paenibacillus sp. MBLB1832]WNR45971.1 Gfo/Idh/MocA family oxidoreductase [Paenibacillus sp. MBLB1832]